MEKQRKDDDKERRKELLHYRGKWTRRVGKVFGFLWRNTFRQARRGLGVSLCARSADGADQFRNGLRYRHVQ